MEPMNAINFWTLFFTLYSWALLATVTGIAAYHRGREVMGWVLLSFFLMGPFALICVLVMPPNERGLEQRTLEREKMKENMKECSKCGNLVKPEFSRCQQCGESV